MSAVRKYSFLLIGPGAALLLYAGSYLLLRAGLPEQIIRHLGPDGAGYGSTPLVLGVAACIAVAAFGIGAWTCNDFTALGHWYAGPKAIVVCFLAAGYGVLALGLGMMLAASVPGTRDHGADTIGYSLLALLLGFSAAAAVLSRKLPEAQRETLG